MLRIRIRIRIDCYYIFIAIANFSGLASFKVQIFFFLSCYISFSPFDFFSFSGIFGRSCVKLAMHQVLKANRNILFFQFT